MKKCTMQDLIPYFLTPYFWVRLDHPDYGGLLVRIHLTALSMCKEFINDTHWSMCIALLQS
jgi:hypothetical protein